MALITARVTVAIPGSAAGDCVLVDDTNVTVQRLIAAGWLVSGTCTPGGAVTSLAGMRLADLADVAGIVAPGVAPVEDGTGYFRLVDVATQAELDVLAAKVNGGSLSAAGGAGLATLDTELLTNGSLAANATGWTLAGAANWSGGGVNLTTSGDSLSQSIAVTSGQRYLIQWTQAPVTGRNDDVYTIAIGAVSVTVPPGGSPYAVITAGATGSLTFSFTGTTLVQAEKVSGFSVKAITADSIANQTLLDSGGTSRVDVRAGSLNNLGLGQNALLKNAVGASNTAIGSGAMASQVGGLGNVAVGKDALGASIGCQYSTAIGQGALAVSTYAYDNTAIGQGALGAATTSYQSTGVGTLCMANLTTGIQNTAIGCNALLAATTGQQNTALGGDSLITLTTGSNNVAVGFRALQKQTTASSNVAVGYTTLQKLTTGHDNTAVGIQAGLTLTAANATLAGNLNTHIGAYSGPGDTSDPSNTTAIGAKTTCIGSGSVAIGTDSGGAGAAATVANQIALGTVNHYTLWRTKAAPADASIATSSFTLWLDDTNGAAKLMVKAKQADGTVKTASVALA